MTPAPDAGARRWDVAYAEGDASCSWTQEHPERSLAAIARVEPRLGAPIIDVGGGASRLAGALLAGGRTDVTVLDVSEAALDLARRRLGADAARVHWLVADVLRWTPSRTYAVWHDRAVLHFFVDDADRARYADTLRRALAPGGHAIIATFAPGGPERCSGLPVRRSSASEILDLLGPGFEEVSAEIETHVTPAGVHQPFSWLVTRYP